MARAGGSEGAPTGGVAPRPTSAVLLADFLTALHDAPKEARPRRLPFHQLSDWLLARATASVVEPSEKRAILRYLAAVLRSEESAQALLARPGAAPALLQLAADSFSLQQLLGAALARAPPPRAVSNTDVAAVMGLLSEWARQRRQRGRSGTGQQQQVLLALQLLLAWARASEHNASRLAEAGAGHLLADLAALSATGSGVDGLQSLIAQVCLLHRMVVHVSGEGLLPSVAAISAAALTAAACCN